MVRRAGLDVSAVKVSQLINRRIDAECYRIEFLELNFWKGFYPLKDLCLIKSGTTPPDRDNELREGVILLKTTDIRNNVLSKGDANDFYYISPEISERMKTTLLQPKDVLINIVGATTDVIGRVAFVPEDFPETNITQAMALLRVVDERLNPAFLFAFLASKHGNMQIRRYARPTGQYNLNLQEVSNFRVPLSPKGFQQKIEKLIITANFKVDESKQLYTDAENLLESELGLDKLDLSESLFNIRNVSEVDRVKRIDAEYFQPKYERTLGLMRKSQKRLSDFADLSKRRFEPELGKPFNYIEISDLTSDGITESQIVQGEEAPSRAQWIVREGDLITSTVRPIRRLSALIEGEQDGFVCSSGFAVLKPKSVSSELLLTYLRIPVVCEILDLYTTASMYPAISTSDLLNIPVTLPTDKKVVNEIVNKVQQSREARKEAKRLLAEAKAEVEKMIEGE